MLARLTFDAKTGEEGGEDRWIAVVRTRGKEEENELGV
jgi:hypothetical protein